LDKSAKIVNNRLQAMAKLTYRNSAGRLVDVANISATRAKNEFGAILEQATQRGAIAITRHDVPKAVLLPFAEFESLVKARSRSLADFESEFDDLLAGMQTAKAKRAVKVALSASPAKLGRAAVRHARKKR
jgi:prevent-host-death family protein